MGILLTEKEAALKSSPRPMKKGDTLKGNPVFEGVFQNYVDRNRNGRIYPKALWQNVLGEGSEWKKRCQEGRVAGVLEHPEDGVTRLSEVSHVILEAGIADQKAIYESSKLAPEYRLKEGDVVGRLVIPNTPSGNVLKALTEVFKWGVSSRGNGDVIQTSQGSVVEANDFYLDTWDAVNCPSVTRAIPRLIESAANSDRQLDDLVKGISEGTVDTLDRKFLVEGYVRATVYFGGNHCHVLLKGDASERQLLENAASIFQKHMPDTKIDRIHIPIDGFTLSGAPVVAQNDDTILSESEIFLTGKGEKEPLVGEGQPAQETQMQESDTPTNTTTNIKSHMSKLHEMKALRLKVSQLARTPVKGLNITDRSSLVEELDSLNYEASKLLSEDVNLSGIHGEVLESIKKAKVKINEMDDDTSSAPPGNDAPPIETGDVSDDDLHGLLTRAADALRDAGGDSAELAAELDDAAVQFSEVDGMDDDAGESIPFTESAHKRLISDHRTLASRFSGLRREHKKVSEAATKLLVAHRSLKRKAMMESRKPVLGKPVLRRSVNEGEGEYKKAATMLAARYNSHTVNLGCKLIESKSPRIWAANRRALTACKTWKSFETLSHRLVQESVEKKAKLEESGKPTDTTTSKVPYKSFIDKSGKEELHETVSFVRRLRRK